MASALVNRFDLKSFWWIYQVLSRRRCFSLKRQCLCLFTCFSESQLNYSQKRPDSVWLHSTLLHPLLPSNSTMPLFKLSTQSISSQLLLFFCFFPSILFFAEVSNKELSSDDNNDGTLNNSDDVNSVTFAFTHAEKMALRIKNGLSSSKYKPADYRRLQAVVDAKWLESDLIGQKVKFLLMSISWHYNIDICCFVTM